MPQSQITEPRLKIGIVGAGISGICAAIQLQEQLGIYDYEIIDENHDFGGVWLVNTYPGCACDIPSHLFSFSFETNPNWSEAYASQPEILEYLRNVAKKHDLYKKAKFNHRVIKTTWDEKISKWRSLIKTPKGEEVESICDIVISCLGGLRIPAYPKEFESFKGLKVHSSRWDLGNKKINLNNKNVSIVGTGASAVQIIPKIVDKVKTLTVYQRKAPWVVPRLQFSFPSWLQWTFSNVPGVQKVFRSSLFWMYELSHNIYMKESTLGKIGSALGKSYLSKKLKNEDETLKQDLIPKYQIGCKRITPSDDYYQALSRSNVKVITSKISQVKDRSIVTEDGHEESIDVLILATGFKVQDFFSPLDIIGKNGVNVMKQWKSEGPSAYLGMATSILPNYFFIIGPNAAPGNTSIIFTVECEVNWIIQVLREMKKRNSVIVTVDEDVEKRHMQKIQRELEDTVWSYDCGSYYRDHRGVVTALNPHSGFTYWKETRVVNFDHLCFQ